LRILSDNGRVVHSPIKWIVSKCEIISVKLLCQSVSDAIEEATEEAEYLGRVRAYVVLNLSYSCVKNRLALKKKVVF
jgi:hypothetical protein